MNAPQAEQEVVELSISGMTCAACSGRIERQLNKLAGVEAVVNLAAEKAHIRYAPKLIDRAALIATIEKTGFGATLSAADTHAEEKARKLAAYREELRRFWISLALTLPLIGQMAFMFSGAWDAHNDVLPRHGHGPSPQVIGGRLFIEGVNCLSARDVYTGRVLWKREFEDLGTHNVYYDDTYVNEPLSVIYNQVHTPGANARGTNYVAAPEGVYLAVGSRCLLLDAATGRTVREFQLPAIEGQQPAWGFIGVDEQLLSAGAGFSHYSQRMGYE